MKHKLISLYFNFLINKIVLLSIIISIALETIIFILLAKESSIMPSYLYNYLDIHNNYFRISFFVMGIFNSVIIAFIGITFTTSSLGFDILFISSDKKLILALIKAFLGFLLIIIINMIEFLILNIISSLYYEYYIFEVRDLFNILEMILSSSILYILILLINTIFNQIVIPLLMMLMNIIVNLLINNISKFKDIYKMILPCAIYKEDIYKSMGTYLGIIWLFIFLFIYLLIYEIKDVKF